MKRIIFSIVAVVVLIIGGILAYLENQALNARADHRASLFSTLQSTSPDATIEAAEAYLTSDVSAPDPETTRLALERYETALRSVITRDIGVSPNSDIEAKLIAYRKTREQALAQLDDSDGLMGAFLKEPPLSAERWLGAARSLFRGFEPYELVPVDLSIERYLEATDDIHTRSNGEEHVRDLLLQAVLSAYQGNAEIVAWSLHDTNPARKIYLNTTSAPKYGTVRTALLEDGIGVLLLPHDASPEERHDWIAKSADSLLMLGGARLRALYIFEYCALDQLHPEFPQAADMDRYQADLFATLRMTEAVEGDRLYTSEFGFIEKEVQDTEGLQAFLDAADDLVAVVDGAPLRLHGRDYKARDYQQISLEHVATLWQALESIEDAEDEFGRNLNQLYRRIAETQIQSFLVDAMVQEGLVRPGTTFDSIENDPQFRPLLNELRRDSTASIEEEITYLTEVYGTCNWHWLRLEAFNTRAGASTGEDALPDQSLDIIEQFHKLMVGRSLSLESRLRGGIGFSLDTEYDYPALRKSFDAYLSSGGPGAEILQELALAIHADLDAGEPGLLHCALDQFGRDTAQYLNTEILDKASFQIARYDGGIQGTEVGQILFLTDLLAKLLDMNFNQLFNAYFPEYPGWKPTVFTYAPAIYEKQLEELPDTRIWFNLRHDAVAEIRDDLRFAPNATRVFALAQDSVSGETERQPGYLSETFVNWFNNNYDLVAAQEPAYDQLNQIVKWSYALDRYASSRKFSYLARESVRRDLFFPQWAEASGVESAKSYTTCFHDRRSRHESLETMPMFHVGWPNAPKTWCDGAGNPLKEADARIWAFRGGVSLPRRSQFVGVKATSRELDSLPPTLRRQTIFKDSATWDGTTARYSEIPTLNSQASYEMAWRAEDKVLRVTQDAKAVKLDRATGNFVPDDVLVYNRGLRFETRLSKNTTSYDLSGASVGRIKSETAVGDLTLSRVSTSIAPGDVRIVVENGPIAVGEGISKYLSRLDPDSWKAALLQEPRVDAVFQLDDVAYARVNNEWLSFTRTSAGDLNVKSDFIGRGSSVENILDQFVGTDVTPVSIRSVAPQEMAAKLEGRFGLEVVRQPRDDGSFVIDVRGPPREPPNLVDSAFVAGDPPQGFFRLALFKDPDNSGRIVLFATEKGRKSLNSSELNQVINGLKHGFDDVADKVIDLPQSVQQSLDLAPVLEGRAAAFRTDLTNTNALARHSADRATRLQTIEKAFDAGELGTARQLQRDFAADGYRLSATERQVLAVKRLEAARRAGPAAARPVTGRAIAAMRSRAFRAESEAIVDDIRALYRREPDLAQSVYRSTRAELGEMAIENAGRISQIDDGLALHKHCMLRKVGSLDSAALAAAQRPYVDASVVAQEAITGWPLSGTLRLQLYRANLPADQKRNIAILRPDEFQIGQKRFVLPASLRSPDLAKADVDPAAREEMVNYFAELLEHVATGGGTALTTNAEEDPLLFLSEFDFADEEPEDDPVCFVPPQQLAQN